MYSKNVRHIIENRAADITILDRDIASVKKRSKHISYPACILITS